MDSQQHEAIQGRVRGVLIEVASLLSAKTIEIVDDLIDHNECGIGLEILCEMLAGSESSIPPVVLDSIMELVAEMKLKVEIVDRLRR
jgi:hypothetical protein